MNSLESVLMMMLMSILTPVMTSTINLVTKTITDAINKLVAYIVTPIEAAVIKPVDNYNCVNIVVKSFNDVATKNKPETIEDVENKKLITSILQYISINNIFSDNVRCNLGPGNPNLINDEYSRSRVFEMIPYTEIVYNDLIISYKETAIKGEESTSQTILIIKSKLPIMEINKFIRKCYDEYINRSSRDASICYINQYLYKHTGCSSYGPSYTRYNINNKMSFNDIFIPDTNKIIELAEKFKNGKLNKLSLLLHGAPGCGKTSIIRALANYLGFSIVEIKLSLFKYDKELIDAFYSPCITYKRSEESMTSTHNGYLPVNKRVYVLEDIDADCNITHRREENAPISIVVRDGQFIAAQSNAKTTTNGEKEEKEKEKEKEIPKLTLAGILNTFDGLLELNTVMVMTTNHVEKLDPALIRSGRVTKTIELKKMSSQDASLLISKYFGPHNIHIPSYSIIPADLDALCQTASNLEEVRAGVQNLLKEGQPITNN